MGVLHGRAGRFTAFFGGFRPGQDEVNALVEETKKALQSQKKQQDPARRAVRAKKVEQLTKELIEERSARAKLEAELVDLRQTMTTAGLI